MSTDGGGAKVETEEVGRIPVDPKVIAALGAFLPVEGDFVSPHYRGGTRGVFCRGNRLYASNGVMGLRVSLRNDHGRCGVFDCTLGALLDADYPPVEEIWQLPAARISVVDARRLVGMLQTLIALTDTIAGEVPVGLRWSAEGHGYLRVDLLVREVEPVRASAVLAPCYVDEEMERSGEETPR